MSDQLHIRNVPEPVRSWIEDERYARKMSQNEFLLSLLERESKGIKQSQLFPLFDDLSFLSQPPPEALPFTFIDLFAGIGGLRLGLQRAGGKCVFTSEWDKYSQKTYKAWFGEMPEGDIRKISPEDISVHDVMTAGF